MESTATILTKRTMENYNIWRLIINNHGMFAKVLDETIERQKRDLPIELAENGSVKKYMVTVEKRTKL